MTHQVKQALSPVAVHKEGRRGVLVVRRPKRDQGHGR